MILDTNLRLELKKDAAASASEPEFHVDFVDWTPDGETTAPATTRGALSASADAVILDAPGSYNPRREPIYIAIHNKDTASHTFTVKTDDGTTERIIFKKAIEAGGTLQYNRQLGWYREAVV